MGTLLLFMWITPTNTSLAFIFLVTSRRWVELLLSCWWHAFTSSYTITWQPVHYKWSHDQLFVCVLRVCACVCVCVCMNIYTLNYSRYSRYSTLVTLPFSSLSLSSSSSLSSSTGESETWSTARQHNMILKWYPNEDILSLSNGTDDYITNDYIISTHYDKKWGTECLYGCFISGLLTEHTAQLIAIPLNCFRNKHHTG